MAKDSDDLPDDLRELFLSLKMQHQEFALHILDGKTQVDAYMLAYPSASKDTAMRQSSRLMIKHEGVVSFIRAYQDKVFRTRHASFDKKRSKLNDIMDDPASDYAAVIAAIREDNRMTGDEKPVKIELSVEDRLYEAITNGCAPGLPLSQ
jgi:hypothetical protein